MNPIIIREGVQAVKKNTWLQVLLIAVVGFLGFYLYKFYLSVKKTADNLTNADGSEGPVTGILAATPIGWAVNKAATLVGVQSGEQKKASEEKKLAEVKAKKEAFIAGKDTREQRAKALYTQFLKERWRRVLPLQNATLRQVTYGSNKEAIQLSGTMPIYKGKPLERGVAFIETYSKNGMVGLYNSETKKHFTVNANLITLQ